MKGKDAEGKDILPVFLGHTVKSCMTVIESDGALSEYLENKYLENKS